MDERDDGEEGADLLPSQDSARVQLALDVGIQVHGLLDVFGLTKDVDEASTNKAVLESRDSDLVGRLVEAIPPRELERATTNKGLDLGWLEKRFPCAQVMHAMTTAGALHRLQGTLEHYRMDRGGAGP